MVYQLQFLNLPRDGKAYLSNVIGIHLDNSHQLPRNSLLF